MLLETFRPKLLFTDTQKLQISHHLLYNLDNESSSSTSSFALLNSGMSFLLWAIMVASWNMELDNPQKDGFMHRLRRLWCANHADCGAHEFCINNLMLNSICYRFWSRLSSRQSERVKPPCYPPTTRGMPIMLSTSKVMFTRWQIPCGPTLTSFVTLGMPTSKP
ncbi:hypothetical protein CIPAW_07G035700 [Carya illinoinensis]|uniref:Uncharacterized protein n=1 Tax=Carya illinoinensis TaxID=32201 RepID=A0A8T1PZG9_CARIL|nr:hypothetical protein CIPAW_07G035700 [Carya illinoinensis]